MNGIQEVNGSIPSISTKRPESEKIQVFYFFRHPGSTIHRRYFSPPEMFPASDELPAGVKLVKFKDREGYGVDFLPNVVYDERNGEKLYLQIMLPMDEMAMLLPQRKKYPLIALFQGPRGCGRMFGDSDAIVPFNQSVRL